MGKVTRVISESEFGVVEEMEDIVPSKPMSREELIKANREYYQDLCALLGKSEGKRAFDSYINNVMSQQGELLKHPTEHHLVRTTLKKATT